jgi:hypothetical protein
MRLHPVGKLITNPASNILDAAHFVHHAFKERIKDKTAPLPHLISQPKDTSKGLANAAYNRLKQIPKVGKC